VAAAISQSHRSEGSIEHLDLKLERMAYMRTSGAGNRDLSMLTVPLVMLVGFGVWTGGGVTGVLKSMERALWVAVDWLGQLIA
jgi:hypothetical protein